MGALRRQARLWLMNTLVADEFTSVQNWSTVWPAR